MAGIPPGVQPFIHAGGVDFYGVTAAIGALPTPLRSILGKLPFHFGQMPGDTVIVLQGMVMYAPFASMGTILGILAAVSKIKKLIAGRFKPEDLAD
ncbi:MAG: hypothetical protein HY078_09275 [Elusimicrobia bacterium]|nr:hypothetical protein [Elusimicrobiota bacterium]